MLYPRQIVLRLEGGMPLRRGTYSRASAAVRKTRPQLAETVASGVPRTEWLRNAQTGLYEPHYLFQGARTNVCLRPRELDNAAWTSSGTPIVTANDAVAPDGSTTADKIEDDDAAAAERRSQAATVANDGATHVAGVFLRKVTTGPVAGLELNLGGGTPKNGVLCVDPRNGNKIAGANLAASGVIDYSATWWFIWASIANNTSGNTSFTWALAPAARAEGDLAAASLAVSATGFNHFWGAEVILNASFPNIGFPDGAGSTFAQAADQLKFAHPHRPQQMWGLVEFEERQSPPFPDTRILTLGDNSESAPRLLLHAPQGADVYRIFHQPAGTSTVATVDLNPALGDRIRLLWVLGDDGSTEIAGSKNGGAELQAGPSAPKPLAAAWKEPTLGIGSRAGGGSLATATALRRAVIGLGPAPSSIAEAEDWIMAR